CAPQMKGRPMSEPITNAQPQISEREAALKLEHLELQIEQTRLELRKHRREDRRAARVGALDERTKQTALDRSVLDLETAVRNANREKALDFENGEFMFCDAVNWDTVKQSIQNLNQISRRFPGKPLTVTLNSPGGSVIAGLALYDHIRDLSSRGHQTTVKCRGMAASMGGILLQAGDVRVVGPEAMVLIHEVSSGALGKLSDMEDEVAFTRKLWEKLAAILASRSTMSADEIMEKAHKFDWWLSAQEAVDLGFADQIG
ncbi:MAG: Clp protease ClpP, partial [Terriglobales bacterium]